MLRSTDLLYDTIKLKIPVQLASLELVDSEVKAAPSCCLVTSNCKKLFIVDKNELG